MISTIANLSQTVKEDKRIMEVYCSFLDLYSRHFPLDESEDKKMFPVIFIIFCVYLYTNNSLL